METKGSLSGKVTQLETEVKKLEEQKREIIPGPQGVLAIINRVIARTEKTKPPIIRVGKLPSGSLDEGDVKGVGDTEETEW